MELVEGEDFYFNDEGLMVLTRAYLLRRGYCCGNGCRHCPYGNSPEDRAGERRVGPGKNEESEE